ncbi:hypothetical protein KTF23_20300 [Burkholderia multivorans]|uniref:hypothetical protein n=2 Tax=Burkholderia multivorans TaxID=87883 RepID=UPI001C243963|nr:hypothetical protein [Burkholderia multivorans]MBU9692168.1 hypothetical protein [Burkholderia multivorans]
MNAGPTTADWAVMAAKSVIQPAAEKAEALAASTGVSVTVKTDVYVEDGSAHWATVLAEMLCADPGLANGNRERMADLLKDALRLQAFTANRLSKRLSRAQWTLVAAILDKHGYDTTTLTTGLSIRDIVKENIRAGSAKPATISTKFHADHIELDGVSFQYRPRERTPMGKAENDFCIRIAGVDVPLLAVLRLRNIGLGEFRLADKRAVDEAEGKQKENRERLEREYKESPRLDRLYADLQRATRDSDKARRKALATRSDKLARTLDIWSYTGQRLERV